MTAHESPRAPSPIRAFAPLAGLLLAFSVGPAPAMAVQQRPIADACIECHLTLDEDRLSAPATMFETDIHAERGFGCLACHGARKNSDALDPSAGFLSKPSRREIPELCGSCHSDAAFMRDYDPSLRVDQVLEYRSSIHGQRLMEEDDADVATCVSCHPAHATRPPSDTESSVYPSRVAELCGSCHGDPEIMGRHDIGTEQLEDYKGSVHGKLMYEEEDLTAPTCNDCHGNHGAAPPGLASVANVCGECHSMMATLFSENGHADLFIEQDLPGCATCHANHAVEEVTDEALTLRSEEICGQCHEDDDPFGHEFVEMKRLVDSLKVQHAAGLTLLEEAENAGMEVGQALFELEGVNTALTKARTAVHSFRVDPVKEEVEAGLEIAEAARRRGIEALEEHRFRRVGLALSTAVIALLIVGLLLKIKDIEERATESLPP